MRILVVDVAASGGGALSVLNRYIEEYKLDTENQYLVCVSVLDYEGSENVSFVKVPWVKRSYAHRLYFDSVYVKRLIKKYKPDVVISLQNKGFNIKKVRQEVLFHNALFICEKRFKLGESRKMWLYQNPISFFTGRSLKRADEIYVQAEWIKNGLVKKWRLDKNKITVKRPEINGIFCAPSEPRGQIKKLFYPAGYYAYKNHRVLLQACSDLWNEKGREYFSLALTGEESSMPEKCKRMLEGKNYPIEFLGNLSPEQMKNQYSEAILVFPSYIETAGLPLIEAKCCGCDIIAADLEYARESVGDYDKVRYFSPFDTEDLKLAIREKIDNGGKDRSV